MSEKNFEVVQEGLALLKEFIEHEKQCDCTCHLQMRLGEKK